MSRPQAIRITIDRLVLHGVPPGDAAAVQRALGEAVRAQLAQAGAVAEGFAAARLDLAVAPAAGPAALGTAAGTALGGRLKGGRP